jgi:hypothetical protein
MEKEILNPAIGALVGLLPVIAAAMKKGIERRGVGLRREQAIDVANRRVGFLSAWLRARQESDPVNGIEGIKASVAKELDDIKASVDEAVSSQQKTQQRESKYVFFSSVKVRTLRRIIGMFCILASAIPLLGYFLFGISLQGSLSDYYYTDLKGIYIGYFFAIGICLCLYDGYAVQDKVFGLAAGLCAMVLAILPPGGGRGHSGADSVEYGSILVGIHSAMFVLFFMIMAFFSIYLFSRSITISTPTRKKLIRNRIYRICGIFMLACIALSLLVFLVVPREAVERYKIILTIEYLLFFANGVSWLTKGQALFKD